MSNKEYPCKCGNGKGTIETYYTDDIWEDIRVQCHNGDDCPQVEITIEDPYAEDEAKAGEFYDRIHILILEIFEMYCSGQAKEDNLNCICGTPLHFGLPGEDEFLDAMRTDSGSPIDFTDSEVDASCPNKECRTKCCSVEVLHHGELDLELALQVAAWGYRETLKIERDTVGEPPEGWHFM